VFAAGLAWIDDGHLQTLVERMQCAHQTNCTGADDDDVALGGGSGNF
jgi:phage gp16-like protein